jgi:aspartyl-tRNA(Asn)/glutamyl-tRNA(Gln) amidotransferase subunit A
MASWDSIQTIAEQVNSGTLKAIDNVEKSLQRIAEKTEYNAIIALTAERARERAKSIDEAVAKGENSGRLAGVPFIAKDNFLVFGADTTAASNILRGFDAPYQSTAIEKLESEGAICVAKANLDAFAHGSSTENSDFMTTLNPYDRERVPGGSSGGSAASVALEMAPFALGTDTGGSIRLPASFCGIVGYKPTYGLVSRSGVVAMASSTDVVGPLTRTVEDTALVLQCMAGQDSLDGTTVPRAAEDYSSLQPVLSGKKIGLISEYLEGLSSEARASVDAAVQKAKNAGARIEEISLPSLPLALAVYYILCPAEVSSNLSRYDGQRFGYSEEEVHNLDQSYLQSRSKGFGDEAKRRIMIGTYVLSSGYYDAYYQKAQLVRTKLIHEFNNAFEQFDFLMGPTASGPAFKIGEHASDPLEMYLTDIMTVAVNLAGIPAISVPSSPVNRLPMGVQLIAPQHKDYELLCAAQEITGENK